jgi:hypothetical protein
MFTKRGQTWSLETYLAIAVFLIAIIFFYGLTTTKGYESNLEVEIEAISKALMGSAELRDGQLSASELEGLLGYNCEELKKRFGTNKEICIYIKDSEGNLIVNGTDTVFGIGCPGINISGRNCGTTEKVT